MDYEALRLRIARARSEAGLFEDDMASQYGITAQMYRRFEAGDAQLPEELVFAIASDLEIPIDTNDRPGPTRHAELP